MLFVRKGRREKYFKLEKNSLCRQNKVGLTEIYGRIVPRYLGSRVTSNQLTNLILG
jgi:hypothetical protein